MNIFITGAHGFVGRNLTEYLIRTTGHTLFTPKSSELDLLNEDAVDEYIIQNNIDVIIHGANRGGGRDTTQMNDVVHANLRMFFNIAKQSPKVQKIIHLGSGAEYGKHKPIIDAKEEDYVQSLPFDEYGFYKAIASKYIEKSDNIVGLRIFGSYGEYENYRFKFISNAIMKNLLHMPIVINKNVYFDYIYIDDLLKMIDWFIHNDAKEKIYNVTTGKKIDLLTLATLVNEVSDFQSEIIVINDGLNNEYTSNNDRLMDELGGFNYTSHKDAIAKMRSYYLANIESLDCEAVKQDPYLSTINTMWKKE